MSARKGGRSRMMTFEQAQEAFMVYLSYEARTELAALLEREQARDAAQSWEPPPRFQSRCFAAPEPEEWQPD